MYTYRVTAPAPPCSEEANGYSSQLLEFSSFPEHLFGERQALASR